jgi:hypothetical protein
MRIVDANTNEDAGVFDSEGRPHMKPGYVVKLLSARRRTEIICRKEVMEHDCKGCIRACDGVAGRS